MPHRVRASQPIRHTSATGAETTYTYNAAGQFVSTIDHLGQVTSHTYHPATSASAGLLWTSTNPAGEVTETFYNTRGQVIDTKGSGTYRVTCGYNIYGEKSEMCTFRNSSSTGDQTQWTYDDATGVLLGLTDAQNHTTTYSYYSTGRLHKRVWARPGEVTTLYTYNAFGDLTNKTYPNSTTPAVTITPDRIGHPAGISDASGTRTLTYHAVTGGLDSVAYGAGGLLEARAIDYTWDSSFRPTGYMVSDGIPSSVVTYDNEGRLDTVYSGGSTHTHAYIPGTGTLSSLTSTKGNT